MSLMTSRRLDRFVIVTVSHVCLTKTSPALPRIVAVGSTVSFGLDVDEAALVVDQVADDDPLAGRDRVADREQAGVRVGDRVVGLDVDVPRLGGDRPGRVDREQRVRLAEQEDGRLPEDLPEAVRGAGLVLAPAVEEPAVAVGIAVVVVVVRVLEHLDPQDGRADDRGVESGHARVALVVEARGRVGVAAAAAAVGPGDRVEVGVLVLGPQVRAVEAT